MDTNGNSHCAYMALLRDFPVPAARSLRELGAHEGGDVRLALTKFGIDCWAIRLK